MLRILLLSSIISIIIEVWTAEEEYFWYSWLDGFGIFCAVAIVAIFTALNNYTKQEQFRKLNEKANSLKLCSVWRNGHYYENMVNEEDLVVGDIVYIYEGKNIPADGIVINSKSLKANESAMTGESRIMKKDTLENCTKKMEEFLSSKTKEWDSNYSVPSPVLLSGTEISEGSGKMIVIAVGLYSCMGKIVSSLSEVNDEKTPLEIKLEIIASDIGKIGLYTAIGTVLVLISRFLLTRISTGGWNMSDISACFQFLVLGITVLVVAIPEGLPLAVTIALAYSVRKMYDQRNLVKQMMSCETMGGATNICTDKTGTLTTNKMNVLSIFIENELKEVDPHMLSHNKDYFFSEKYTSDLLIESICSNATASKFSGSATEIALLNFVEKLGFNSEEMKSILLSGDNYIRYFFNSKRKLMSTIIFNVIDKTKIARIHMKGAPEIVIKSCNYYYKSYKEINILNEEHQNKIFKIIKSLNEKSFRTIMLAYKDLDSSIKQEPEKEGKYEIEESGFTFLGLIAMRDTIRENVKEAVEKCHNAGIVVRMVSGDNLITAKSIAEECNIIQEESLPYTIMEGEEFTKLLGGIINICEYCQKETCDCFGRKIIKKVKNINKFIEIKDNLRVLARSRPQDKLLLVTALKEINEVVAVTGDGTNDASALKEANVSFAMGIAGTDVAKNAADIILLDDNFASIIVAILWGRNIYASIRKFIQFQISVNIVALASSFVSSCIIKESPLKPIQLLWINLIMDSLASLALATDPPNESVLNGPPYKKDEYIISRIMMKHIIGQAIYQMIVLFTILFAGQYFIPEEHFEVEGIPIYQGNYVRPGFKFTFKGEEDHSITNLDQVTLYSNQIFFKLGPPRHFTFYFCTFIFLQLINEYNCRKIEDELNIFSGLQNNPISIFVRFAETILSIIFIQYGGRIFNMSIFGLTNTQWFLSISFGLGSLVVHYFLVLSDSRVCLLLYYRFSSCIKKFYICIVNCCIKDAYQERVHMIKSRNSYVNRLDSQDSNEKVEAELINVEDNAKKGYEMKIN